MDNFENNSKPTTPIDKGKNGPTEPNKVPSNAGERGGKSGGSTGAGKPDGEKDPKKLPLVITPKWPVSSN